MNFQKTAIDQSDLMATIMEKVGGMVALGMNRGTISYYLMTEVGDAGWSGLDKVMFVGMVEEALDKMGVK